MCARSEQSDFFLNLLLFPILELVVILNRSAHNLLELFVAKVVLLLCSLDACWELALQLLVGELVSRWVQEAIEPALRSCGSLRFGL